MPPKKATATQRASRLAKEAAAKAAADASTTAVARHKARGGAGGGGGAGYDAPPAAAVAASKRRRTTAGSTAAAAAAAAPPTAAALSASALAATRARLVSSLPKLDEEKLASILTTLLADDAVVRTVASLPLFNQPCAMAKCGVCKSRFDASMNFSTTACVSEEHAFDQSCGRGECPSCRGWDSSCGYCTHCGSISCEVNGFMQPKRSYSGQKFEGTREVCRVGRHTTENLHGEEEDDDEEDDDDDDDDDDEEDEDGDDDDDA